MKFIPVVFMATITMLTPLGSFAQETADETLDQSERLEKREAKRAEMRERFESLSDEERASIKQRRQARVQNHQRDHRILRQSKRKNSVGHGQSPTDSSTNPSN